MDRRDNDIITQMELLLLDHVQCDTKPRTHIMSPFRRVGPSSICVSSHSETSVHRKPCKRGVPLACVRITSRETTVKDVQRSSRLGY